MDSKKRKCEECRNYKKEDCAGLYNPETCPNYSGTYKFPDYFPDRMQGPYSGFSNSYSRRTNEINFEHSYEYDSFYDYSSVNKYDNTKKKGTKKSNNKTYSRKNKNTIKIKVENEDYINSGPTDKIRNQLKENNYKYNSKIRIWTKEYANYNDDSMKIINKTFNESWVQMANGVIVSFVLNGSFEMRFLIKNFRIKKSNIKNKKLIIKISNGIGIR